MRRILQRINGRNNALETLRRSVHAAWEATRRVERPNLTMAVVLVAVATMGTAILMHSHAASNIVTVEAENGTLANGAATVNDDAASGGKAIKFGAGAPDMPTGLQVFTGGPTITLMWKPSNGAVAAASYAVYRNGTQIGTASPDAGKGLVYEQGTRFNDPSTNPGTTYSYQVAAVSAAGQKSALSTAVSVKAPVDTTPVPTITVDASQATDLTDWLTNVVAPELRIWYPKMSDRLAYPDYTPPSSITLRAVPGLSDIAHTLTAQGTIEFQAEYARQHPEDIGMFIHESTHIIQNAPTSNTPFWLQEGLADWTRAYFYQDQNLSLPNAKSDLYTQGYGKAAYFLQWIAGQNHPAFIRDISQAVYHNTYSPTWIQNATSKTPDQWWSQMTGHTVTSALIKAKNFDDRCVDNNHSQLVDGNIVQVYSCSGGQDTQVWARIMQDNGNATLQLLQGKCLDVSGSGTANGTKVQIWTCNNSGAQDWKFNANGTITNVNSGKCLHNPATNGGWGQQLDIQTCNSSDPDQLWTFPYNL